QHPARPVAEQRFVRLSEKRTSKEDSDGDQRRIKEGGGFRINHQDDNSNHGGPAQTGWGKGIREEEEEKRRAEEIERRVEIMRHHLCQHHRVRNDDEGEKCCRNRVEAREVRIDAVPKDAEG